ncbi:MAG: flap endonuclease-1 [Nanoarchaeota archaeon]
MGVQLTELLIKKPITFADLKGKVVAIDAFNQLYQFLTSIRQPDGQPLTDSSGNTTSHLIGLFSRTTRMLQQGIRPIFVFDGTPPKLKTAERERRKALKQAAAQKYETATQEHDLKGMKKFASRTSRLTTDMVIEAKELVETFGLPAITAPSEGEAQAAHLVREGKAYALVSQDADGLLFGASRLIRNLSFTGRRKNAGRVTTEHTDPELVDLNDVLTHLDISQEQLICLALLVGTDYNIGGIRGIGPKKALGLIKKHKDPKDIFSEIKWDEQFPFPWQDAFDLFVNMPVNNDLSLIWNAPNEDKLIKLLVEKHEFSRARVEGALESLSTGRGKQQQKGLGEFI